MNEFLLHSKHRKFFKAIFWITPISILLNLLFHIVALVAKASGVISLDGEFVYFVGVAISLITVVCVIAMLSYSVIYLYHLWNMKMRAKFAVGILMFIFYNFLIGYLWYYQREIRHKEIQIGWPFFHIKN